jgi:hypothetical protein
MGECVEYEREKWVYLYYQGIEFSKPFWLVCTKCVLLIEWWMGVGDWPEVILIYNRVSTLCNQLLSHLWVDILQSLHSCYGHIQDVHIYFLEVFAHSLKNLHVVDLGHFPNMFWIVCVINSSHTSRMAFSNFLDSLPSAFLIYLHQLMTVSIIDTCFRAARPFLVFYWFPVTYALDVLDVRKKWLFKKLWTRPIKAE